MRPYLLICLLTICNFAYSQSSLPEFSYYSAEEINLKECAFDKKAEAIVLLDEAVSDYDDNYRLITRRRMRIKILHQREADRGNIRIRFYSKDKFEYISNIRGVTYNTEDGRPVLSTLDKKSIFTEKEDNIFSSVKFALPNVKAGSIIEYEYTSNKEHYGGLSDWIFQHDIPTLKSCYLLSILPNTEFQYQVQKKASYPIVVKPMPEQGKIYFEMNNIGGLKHEPYMDAMKDYLQKVDFQLAGYTRYGSHRKVNQTWPALAYDLMTDKSFGQLIKKDLPGIDELKEMVAKEISDSGKVATIYNYVRNNLTWNGYYATYAGDGLKNPWQKRNGSAAEINLILISLLQTFDLGVSPLLIAERDFGKVDTDYPFIDRFNKVAAYVVADGHNYILDATQKYCPPGLTPYPLLNTIAFVVDKKDSKLIKILSGRYAYTNTITLNAELNNKGLLKGTGKIISDEYAKQVRTEKIKTDPKNFIKDVLQESANEMVVDDCTFDNLDDDNKPLEQNITFHYEQDLAGGFAFLNYNLFTDFAKSPFTAEERFSNINFGYPYNIALQLKVQLPENSKIDKLPADKEISSSDKQTVVTRKLKVENNVLTATIIFRQNNTLVKNDDYSSLKSLYQRITDLLNEQVVIKVN